MAESLAVHLPDSLSIRNRPGSLGSGEGSELVCYIQQFKPLRKRETQALRGLGRTSPAQPREVPARYWEAGRGEEEGAVNSGFSVSRRKNRNRRCPPVERQVFARREQSAHLVL